MRKEIQYCLKIVHPNGGINHRSLFTDIIQKAIYWPKIKQSTPNSNYKNGCWHHFWKDVCVQLTNWRSRANRISPCSSIVK
jgi:hypothetical protein